MCSQAQALAWGMARLGGPTGRNDHGKQTGALQLQALHQCRGHGFPESETTATAVLYVFTYTRSSGTGRLSQCFSCPHSWLRGSHPPPSCDEHWKPSASPGVNSEEGADVWYLLITKFRKVSDLSLKGELPHSCPDICFEMWDGKFWEEGDSTLGATHPNQTSAPSYIVEP